MVSLEIQGLLLFSWGNLGMCWAAVAVTPSLNIDHRLDVVQSGAVDKEIMFSCSSFMSSMIPKLFASLKLNLWRATCVRVENMQLTSAGSQFSYAFLYSYAFCKGGQFIDIGKKCLWPTLSLWSWIAYTGTKLIDPTVLGLLGFLL